jgi:LysM repeat protein
MGNLEKAGVLVVVGLLAVILVVAFLNFPDDGSRRPPVLGASVASLGNEVPPARPRPINVPPSPPEVIRPGPDGGRRPSDPPPVEVDPPSIPAPKPPLSDGKPSDSDRRPELPPPSKLPAKDADGYPKVVKVQRGDTLWGIAVREYGPKVGPLMLGAIADANPKVRPEALKAGVELSLPSPAKDGAEASPKPKVEPPGKKASPPAAGKTSRDSKPAARKLPFVPVGS